MRGHHLDLIAGFVEGDLGKEVLLLLKCVSDEGGNLWALIGHVDLLLPLLGEPCRTRSWFGNERLRVKYLHDRVGGGAPDAAFRVMLIEQNNARSLRTK